MKQLLLILAAFNLISLGFYPPIENEETFFDRLMDDPIIMHQGGLAKGAKAVNEFVSHFGKEYGQPHSYEKTISIEVNSTLDYEIGEINAGSKDFSVMFLKRKDLNSKIEFLVIYENSEAESQTEAIDQMRTQWMELCNSHQANELVKQLYTRDAYYYNRGRLLQGTRAISEEYSYMNRPNYSLTLTPKHVAFVTPEVAYEIGRCSGSYPNPYMLLWQKQNDGSWQVLMDTNY